ncbi:SAM-dependent methyltransferase [Mycobacterium adipatum]|uniref:SAM-dependent methyltransferase n=2 Tax=Mycobacterium adipatum TaxID=1682113 RepID=A0A172UQS6_9MYCO|nr:SAM-dependent methyltransferase [Mycobacterium adipatum]MBI5737616.1 class I SAM-dependent methyltransferase [Mycolicibacterium neoaurum]
MDWDAAYSDRIFVGPPPWNIGEAQPEIAALIEAGKITSPVLDAGCGVGDVSLALAAAGYDVVGADISTVAIDAATRAAAARGLTNVRFVQGDLRTLTVDGDPFNTIVDCTLFHSLPVEAREDYLRGVHAVSAPGAVLHMLVFTTDALPPDSPFPVPNLVTEAELREVVSRVWTIENVQPAFVAVQLPDVPNLPEHNFASDDKGRVKLPALLLTARKH